jgi:hypothetical protein
MRRKVVIAVIAVLVLGSGWMLLPAFSEPAHHSCAHADGGSWGYDLAGRAWTCGDNWLVRLGDYGVNGV